MKAEKNDASAAVTPLFLLPISDRHRRSAVASIFGEVFNVSTSMIGAGIMLIPTACKVLGIIPGFIVIVIMALLAQLTIDFLLRYTHSEDSNSYAGVMAESFGKIGSLSLQFCVLISNLGALIIYLIIIGDVLSGSQSGGTLHLGILQGWFSLHWWNSRSYALLFIMLFVMLPLLLQRHVGQSINPPENAKSENAMSIKFVLRVYPKCIRILIPH